jgi:hypothetical protein
LLKDQTEALQMMQYLALQYSAPIWEGVYALNLTSEIHFETICHPYHRRKHPQFVAQLRA